METIRIPCQEASDHTFSLYGQYISDDLRSPDASDNELKFWNKLGVMDHAGNTSVSIVQTYGKNGLAEHTLERHARTSELLIPTQDIIVVAALTKEDDPELPNLDTVKAFWVKKGSAVRLYKGTWHHAPLTQAEMVHTFVLFYENTPDEDFLCYDLGEKFGISIEVIP
ncbi:MAG: ureidoglycolate lyase [Spirochaetales bacterium]|jgi:ureidoglycolate hydrolase|nr:ureidoglycolate lyase [Spirochaetales bacterium]